MPRILAIDYGMKRVGLAVTDPLQIIATPLTTVSNQELPEFLQKYCQQEDVETIVVGMPTNLDGSSTDMTPHVKGLMKRLREAFPQKQVVPHDERLTSVMALDSMIAMGSSKKDRRPQTGNLDKMSAAIILQSYIETKANEVPHKPQ